MVHVRHVKEKVTSVLKDDDELTNTKRVEKVLEEIRRVAPDFELTQAEVSVILVNPKLFRLDRRSRLSLRPEELVYAIDKHIILSNEFRKIYMAPPDRSNIPIPPVPEQYAKTTFHDTPRKKNTIPGDVLRRDSYKCIMTELASPEAAHILPHSAYGTKDAKRKIAECWEVTKTLVDPKFCDEYIRYFVDSIGFETLGNMVSLGRDLHNYLDRGFWAFRPQDRKPNDLHNRMAFYWMTDVLRPKDGKPVTIGLDGGRNTIKDMLKRLHQAYKRGYDAPLPRNGDGHIAGWLRDGKKIKSGHIFETKHHTIAEARLFHDMIRLHWECICLLMLRGVCD